MPDAKQKQTPLEAGLIAAMTALDNQIAREMQRSPADRDRAGVQKWEPYQKRIENVCSLVLNSLGEGQIQLDSLLVLSQAMAKSLRLVIDDLGREGLGLVRSEYSLSALKQIERDCQLSFQTLKEGPELS